MIALGVALGCVWCLYMLGWCLYFYDVALLIRLLVDLVLVLCICVFVCYCFVEPMFYLRIGLVLCCCWLCWFVFLFWFELCCWIAYVWLVISVVCFWVCRFITVYFGIMVVYVVLCFAFSGWRFCLFGLVFSVPLGLIVWFGFWFGLFVIVGFVYIVWCLLLDYVVWFCVLLI